MDCTRKKFTRRLREDIVGCHFCKSHLLVIVNLQLGGAGTGHSRDVTAWDTHPTAESLICCFGCTLGGGITCLGPCHPHVTNTGSGLPTSAWPQPSCIWGVSQQTVSLVCMPLAQPLSLETTMRTNELKIICQKLLFIYEC